MLAAVYGVEGHTASWAVCRVAEAEGRVVGVMAGFAAAEADRLARRFVALTVRRMPPWRWPAVARHVRAAATLTPHTPARSWYVDALAVDPGWRRRGVARALLRAAEAEAASAGLAGVALDTGLANHAARALYARLGFSEHDVRRARTDRIAAAVGGPGFVGYFKPRQPCRTCVSASATRATWPSVMAGKNGSATERSATSSQTGNSPGRWPKRSR